MRRQITQIKNELVAWRKEFNELKGENMMTMERSLMFKPNNITEVVMYKYMDESS